MKSAISKTVKFLQTSFLFALSLSAAGEEKPPTPTIQKIPCGIAEIVAKQIYARAYDLSKHETVGSMIPTLETSISSIRYMKNSSEPCSKVNNFLNFLEASLTQTQTLQKEEERPTKPIVGFTSRSSVRLDEELKKNSEDGSFSGQIRPKISEHLFDKDFGGSTRIEQIIRSE